MKRFVLYTYRFVFPATSLLRRGSFLGALLLIVLNFLISASAFADPTATATAYAGGNWAYAVGSTHTHTPPLEDCPPQHDFQISAMAQIECQSGNSDPEFAQAEAQAEPPWQTWTLVWVIGSEARLNIRAVIPDPEALPESLQAGEAVSVDLTIDDNLLQDDKLPLWAFVILFKRPEPADDGDAADDLGTTILAAHEVDLNGALNTTQALELTADVDKAELGIRLEAGGGIEPPFALVGLAARPTAVDPQRKLATTWARIKTKH